MKQAVPKTPVLEMYEIFRAAFPDITAKADQEHISLWGDLDPEFAYSWFESLANALNQDMRQGAPAGQLKPIFDFFRVEYAAGGEEVKDCIDVSFTENLFWEVPPEKAGAYWRVLPGVLRELYLGFHCRTPF